MKWTHIHKKGRLLKSPSTGCQANDRIIRSTLLLPDFSTSRNILLPTAANKLQIKWHGQISDGIKAGLASY